MSLTSAKPVHTVEGLTVSYGTVLAQFPNVTQPNPSHNVSQNKSISHITSLYHVHVRTPPPLKRHKNYLLYYSQIIP